jgi:aspartyl-tRNA(Asn)/glutamyl-tRNA(Gln) amidotransferase subunit C
MENESIDVYQVAHLARMELSVEEAALFHSQLEPVLDHVHQLSKLNLDGVEPTAHTRPIFNVLRTDEPRKGLEKSAALANAPHQANGMFSVTKVLDS